MSSGALDSQAKQDTIQSTAQKLVSLTTRNRRPLSDEEMVEEYPDPVTSAPSSVSSARKRSSSQVSAEDLQHSGRNFPSLSTSGGVSRSRVSPKDICLCQADPKVPRPRNGKF